MTNLPTRSSESHGPGTSLTALVGGTMLALACLPAHAAIPASTPEAGGDNVEEVVITGSLIAKPNDVASSPIVTVSTAQLEQAGTVTLEAALKQMPGFAPSTNSNSAGPATLNLHGLGTNRNLVLLDGHRLPLSDISGNVDTNLITDAMLAGVDVITGGASAVYGSDAMSGVVNFRTLKNFEGMRVDVQYGNSAKQDAQKTTTTLTAGTQFGDGKGHAMLTLGYSQAQALKGAKRDFFNLITPSSFIGQGTFVPSATNLPNQAVLNGLFTGYGATTPVSNTLNLGFNDNGTLFTQTGAKHYLGPTSGGYAIIGGNVRMPVGPQGYIVAPFDRKSVFSKFDYELTPTVTAYGQVLYVQTALTGDTSKSLTQFGTLTTVPTTNPFIPTDLATLLASRPNPTAAFTWNGRYVGIPGKAFEETRNTSQFLGGLKGQLPIRNWTWDIYAAYDSTTHNQALHNAVLKSQVQRLLSAADGGNSLCAGGFNPFGLNHSANISAACQGFMTATAQSNEQLSQSQVQGVIQGSVATLPAGDLSVAVLAGTRRNAYAYSPDFNLATQNIEAVVASLASQGSIGVKEGAVQVDVPLLKDAAFARSLGFGAAYRYSDYTATGAVSSYEGDLKWRPADNVLMRAGYQRAVRAPNIGELYAAATGSQTQFGTPPASIGDPCDIRSTARTGANGASVRALCLAQGIPAAVIDTYTFPTTATGSVSSGNLSLTPETADTWNMGLVWTPGSMGPFTGVSTSVDYYKISIKNVISVVPGLTTLSKCYNLDGTNPSYSAANVFCSLLTRDVNGQLTLISLPFFNLGGLKTDGIDFQAAAALPVGNGKLVFNTNLGYTRHYEVQTLPGQAFQDFAGTNTLGASRPRYKALTSLGYTQGDASVSLSWRYLAAMKDASSVTTPASPGAGVGTYNLYDLSGSYRIGEKWFLRGGVTNLLDKGSPIVSSSQNSTDLAVYDSVGRSYFLGVRLTL
jgi:outer membrane receptor protein involved in Fe transport